MSSHARAGPISSVYHLLLSLPPTRFWSNILPMTCLLWVEKKYSGVTFGCLHWDNILFLISCCQALSKKTANFDKLKLATKQILLMSSWKTNIWLLNVTFQISLNNPHNCSWLKMFRFGSKSQLAFCWTWICTNFTWWQLFPFYHFT